MVNTPTFLKNITLAQVLAIMGWAGAQAVAFGWLTGTKEQIIMSAGATIVAAIWKAADAWIQVAKIKSAAGVYAAGEKVTRPVG